MRINRYRINISHHARMRFIERFPELDIKTLQNLAAKARYEGFSDKEFEGAFRCYLNKVTKKDNSTRIRVLNGKVFVFKGNAGHCRTLLTLYPVPENFKDYEKYLINRKNVAIS